MHIVQDGIADRDVLERPAQMQLVPEEKKPNVTPVVMTKQATITDAKPAVEEKKEAAAPVAKEKQPVIVPEVKTAPATPVAMTKQATVAPVEQPFAVPAMPVAKTASVMHDSASAMPYRSSVTTPVERVPFFPPVTPAPVQTKPVQQVQMPVPKAEKEPEQIASFLGEAPKQLRIIGTVFNTYILVEYEDHLLLIDQHAVHERLMFDRLMKAYDQHAMAQELLIPMVMNVTRREQALLEENSELPDGLGLTVESFGENEIAVRSIPMVLGQPQAEGFVRDILDQLQGERGVVTMEKRRSAILQIACKKAVKGGDVLSEDEIRHLVMKMIDDKVTPTCPHGRPLVVSLSHQEMDKRFKRIQ